MLALRLDPELERELEKLAKETKRSKSYHAKEALKQYLEDRSDYLQALAVLEKNNSYISLEDMKLCITKLDS